MKKKLIILAVILLALIGGISSMVVTREDEYTMIMRFGKMDRVTEHAGLSFKIPFVETTVSIPNQILLYDMAQSDVITKDKKTMITDSYVLWKIVDPLKFAKSLNSSVDGAEGRIDAVVYNATKNAISNLTQDEVIASRDGELQKEILDSVGNSLDSYGIMLLELEIKRMDLPEDNKEAVYERMISERNKIAASYQAEGDSEAQIIRNTTDKEIEIMLSDAEAEAAKTIAEGESEYMQILAAAYNSPERVEFYEFSRALESAKLSMSGGNKTLILPADSPLAEIFLGE